MEDIIELLQETVCLLGFGLNFWWDILDEYLSEQRNTEILHF